MPSVASRVLSLQVRNKPLCQSGSLPYGWVDAFTILRMRLAIDRNEAVEFLVPAEARAASFLQVRRMVLFALNDGSAEGAFYEFRIYEIEQRIDLAMGNVLAIKARGLAGDLTDAGPYYELTGGGRQYQIATASKTCSQWLDAIVTHLTAEGYAYIIKGTVTPATTEVFDLAGQTPMQLMNELATRTRSEWYLERNGTSNYKLHLVPQYTTSVGATVRMIEGKNLRALSVLAQDFDQMLVVQPHNSSAFGATAQWNGQSVWKITSVDNANNTITIGSVRAGSSEKCIPFDNWGIGLVVKNLTRGYWRMTVTDSDYATQKLTVDDEAICVAGDWVMFFEAGTPALWLFPAQGSRVGYGSYVARVSAVSSNDLTIVGRFGGTVMSDSSYTGLWAMTTWGQGMGILCSTPVVASLAVSSRDFNSGTKTLTVSSTTGIQAGDWGFVSTTNTGEPYTLPTNMVCFEVTGVPNGTTLEIVPRYKGSGLPAGNGAVTWYAFIYRPRANKTWLTALDPATDKQTVQSNAVLGAVANDVLEWFTLRGDRRLHVIESPLLATYGSRKTMIYSRTDLALPANLVDNHSIEETPTRWWSATRSAGTDTLNGAYQATCGNAIAQSPNCFLPIESENDYINAAAVLSVWSNDADASIGASYQGIQITSPHLSWILAMVKLASAADTSAIVDSLDWRVYPSQASAWKTLAGWKKVADLVGLAQYAPIAALTTGGPAMLFVGGNLYSDTGGAEGYCSAVAMWISAGPDISLSGSVPSNTAYQTMVLSGGPVKLDGPGDGDTFWAKAGELLAAHDDAPVTVTVGIGDLCRVSPEDFSSLRQMLGAWQRLVAPTFNIDVTVRVVALEPDFDDFAKTQITLNTQPQLASRLLR